MKKRLTLWALPILLLLATVSAHEECTTLTLHGILLDSDCDGVTDAYDNCPFTPNAMQEDSNRDFIGDACDLLIEEVNIKPSVIVRSSELFGLQVTLVNNQPHELHAVQIEVKNRDLDISTMTNIPAIAAGEARTTEFLLKIPRCTDERQYKLDVTTRYVSEGKEHVEYASQNVKVAEGGLCDEPESAHENTLIETFFEQELDVGETAIFPLHVLNMNEEAVSYSVRMEGLGPWATYRVDPEPYFTLASGHETTQYITIEMEDWTPLGFNQGWVIIGADGVEQAFPINLFVREPLADNYEQLKRALEVTLILLVLVMLIVGFVLAYKKANEDPKTNQDHKYLEEAGVDRVEGKR